MAKIDTFTQRVVGKSKVRTGVLSYNGTRKHIAAAARTQFSEVRAIGCALGCNDWIGGAVGANGPTSPLGP